MGKDKIDMLKAQGRGEAMSIDEFIQEYGTRGATVILQLFISRLPALRQDCVVQALALLGPVRPGIADTATPTVTHLKQ